MPLFIPMKGFEIASVNFSLIFAPQFLQYDYR